MSTPSIAAPTLLGRRPRAGRGARARLSRMITGRAGDPSWSRPLLILVALLAGVLTLWGLARNGYANTYYAEAAQAASRSWTAWLTNALDVSGSDSLDKGPLPNMLMGLSGRLLGFSSFSMLLPQALCGVASVLLLHNVVRRTLGHRAAMLAALMLALTPIFIAISRFNNPDALLVLTELAAAWALVRTLESGRTRHLLLCGAFVGLAFNVKMLQAYLIVPGLALTFLIAGRGRMRRRLVQLAAGGGAMIAVSFAWYGTMMLLPAGQRPWVGDTTDNSWFSLIFGANGLSRVSGTAGGAGPGFGGSPGPLRLFDTALGGQIAWLAPLAVCGLVLGLCSRRGARRTDRARSAYLLWGGWGLVSWGVFSFSTGIFHPYYTTALAPAIAVLAASGLLVLWDRSRGSRLWSAALAAVVIGTGALSLLLLARTGGFVPWLGPSVLAVALIAAAGLMLAHLPRRRPAHRRRALARVALLAGLVAVLAGPASYSLATVGRSLSGTNPLAGPAGAAGGGTAPGGAPSARGALGALAFSGAGGRAGTRSSASRLPRLGSLPGSFGSAKASAPPAGSRGAPGAGMGATVSRAMISYLEARQRGARFLVAAIGSSTAASIALQSGRDVIDMGGFSGSDPSPSLTQLQGLVHGGQLHYVLLDSAHRGSAAGSRAPAARTRDRWIENHGKAIRFAGRSAGGLTLYYVPSNA